MNNSNLIEVKVKEGGFFIPTSYDSIFEFLNSEVYCIAIPMTDTLYFNKDLNVTIKNICKGNLINGLVNSKMELIMVFDELLSVLIPCKCDVSLFENEIKTLQSKMNDLIMKGYKCLDYSKRLNSIFTFH